MGLFRRKKKRETQSTSKPQDGNLDIVYGNVKYNTRQSETAYMKTLIDKFSYNLNAS